MHRNRPLFVIALLILAMLMSFALPKTKYKSPDILSALDIPYAFRNWKGQDISGHLNAEDLRYNFISKAFAGLYEKPNGENLLFIILDAGNFHNPKVCFESSGFVAKDLTQIDFDANGRVFKAHAVYFEKEGHGLVVIYWMCINKRIVDWGQQKIIEFWYSLLNKQKSGLMVRLDIPASSASTERAIRLAQEFISDMASYLPAGQIDYIFGLKN